MSIFGKSNPRGRGEIGLRALIIGVLLIPLTSYWIIQMEKVRPGPYPSTISLFANAIFILAGLIFLNWITGKIRRSWALTQAELLVVYTMVAIATSLSGHDMLPTLVMMLSHVFWFGTKENQWQEMFGKFLPDHLVVRNKNVIEHFYTGNSSIYRPEVFNAWIGPVLWWTAFIFALGLIMVAISILVRNLWVQRERLTYPILELPIQMTNPDGALWRNKLFWLGIFIAASIDILNGLNYLYPWIPTINVKHVDIMGFQTKPLNAMGWLPISFYPFAIGLGYLLPVDLLFSCWFFYFFFKFQLVLSSAMGWDAVPNFPFIREQGYGGYLALTVILFWNGRKYLAEVIKRAAGFPSEIDDSKEGMSYRMCFIVIGVASVFLLYFLARAGMSVVLAAIALFMYFVISVIITRIRAELGPPVHDQHFSGPDELIPQSIGTKNLSDANLTSLSWFFWFNRAYRSHPMPVFAEGLKAGNVAQASQRKFTAFIIAAIFIGTLAGFWAYLFCAYKYGTASKFAMAGFAWEPFNRLAGWMNNPSGPNWPANNGIGFGFVVALVLGIIRNQVFNFPFHPIGFAISGSWAMNLVWFPLLLAWIIKSQILRYGGLRQYKILLPLFLGLILGQCLVGCFWSLLGLFLDIPTYSYWGA